jgi:hypothetical protein
MHTMSQLVKWAKRGIAISQFKPTKKTYQQNSWKEQRGIAALKAIKARLKICRENQYKSI